MKVLGESSLSSKIKFVLDAAWIVGCMGVGIWMLIAFFLLSGNFSCLPNEACSSSASIGSVGFKMDSTSNQLSSTEGGIAYFSEGEGKLTIQGPINKSTAVAMVVESAILGFLFLVTIWQLRKLFKTLVLGNPFTEANTKTLKLIAASIFGISLFSGLFSFVNSLLLSQQFKGQGIHLVANGDFNLTTLFAAAVVFILSEIFRLGSQLEDEKAHTV